MPDVLRYAAFTDTPAGGNPAGIVLDARGLDDAEMLRIAAQVGFSETAFVVGGSVAERVLDVRYFSPEAEVPFCGHATIATGVALAERHGPGDWLLRVPAGEVPVRTAPARDGGAPTATLTSVTPSVRAVGDEDLAAVLALLRWAPEDLDPALAPRIAFAGAHHLVLPARTRERLARLAYDFEGLKRFMLDRDLTTVDLVWREAPLVFWARNPFPVGGVVEDPATGAAAAAFGAYLRDLGAVTPPATVTVHQGDDLGRPSLLQVDLAADRPEVRVTGAAVPMDTAEGG